MHNNPDILKILFYVINYNFVFKICRILITFFEAVICVFLLQNLKRVYNNTGIPTKNDTS